VQFNLTVGSTGGGNATQPGEGAFTYNGGTVVNLLAVADAGFEVHRLAVREIPRSGKPDELLDRFGISARHIMEAVRAVALVDA